MPVLVNKRDSPVPYSPTFSHGNHHIILSKDKSILTPAPFWLLTLVLSGTGDAAGLTVRGRFFLCPMLPLSQHLMVSVAPGIQQDTCLSSYCQVCENFYKAPSILGTSERPSNLRAG